MKGDFTRWNPEPSQHFRRVLRQQGRVTLDADDNEQASILLHALRTLARDVFGAWGGPVDGSGFGLAMASPGANQKPTLWIAPGHVYVDGLLVECDAPGCWYQSQPDLPLAADDALLRWLASPVANQKFWVYLDVWERHVSWIEDDSVREVALGGPDTCTRSKVVWQIRALPWSSDWDNANDTCSAPLASLSGVGDATLAAQVDPGLLPADPCVLAPDALYRGAENQLYRVEVHQGGKIGDEQAPTFKWSRDNASIATPWLGLGADSGDQVVELVVASTRGFETGHWIELSDDGNDLAGTPGQLVQVVRVAGDRLVVDRASVPGGALMNRDDALHPRARRWDQLANDVIVLNQGAVPITEGDVDGAWGLELEYGIQVRFGSGATYRCGDYWVIAARVATGTIDWPQAVDANGTSGPAPQPPLGITHAYAPLGILSAAAASGVVSVGTACRRCATTLPTADCAEPTLPPAGDAAMRPPTGVAGKRAAAPVATRRTAVAGAASGSASARRAPAKKR